MIVGTGNKDELQDGSSSEDMFDLGTEAKEAKKVQVKEELNSEEEKKANLPATAEPFPKDVKEGLAPESPSKAKGQKSVMFGPD
jgi:hypothetical protein